MTQALIDRERLRRATEGAGTVVLMAPSGYGKTTLARQLAGPGPTAWVAAADEMGETELAGAIIEQLVTVGLTPDALTGGLATVAYALRDFVGEAVLVIDDCHRLEPDVIGSLLSMVGREKPAGLRVIVAGWDIPLGGLGPLEATGDVVVLTAQDLAFDASEASQLLRSDAEAITAFCGNWPLALGLARSRLDRGLSPFSSAHKAALVVNVLAPLPEELTGLLAFLARLGPWSSDELVGVAPRELRSALEHFVDTQPALVGRQDSVHTMQDVLREGLTSRAPSQVIARAFAAHCRISGNLERSLDALAAGEVRSELATALESACDGLVSAGRFSRIRALAGALPEPHRPDRVRLAAMRASMEVAKWSTKTASPADVAMSIESLHGRCHGEDRLVAAAILVDHYRYHGDARLAPAVLEAIPPWLNLLDPGFDLDAARERLASATERAATAYADLLGAGALVLGLSGVADLARSSPLAYDLGLAAATRAGNTTAYVSKNAHVQWVLGFADPLDVADRFGPVIAEFRRVGHPHVANRLVDRADMHQRVGQFREALRLATEAHDWAERTGNQFSLVVARAVRHSAQLMTEGVTPALVKQGEEIWQQAVADPLHARWLPVYAAREASVLFDLGDVDRARQALERMRSTRVGNDAFDRVVGWEAEGQEIRLLIRSEHLEVAHERVERLATEILASGLHGLERRLRGLFAADWRDVTGDASLAEREAATEHQSAERWRLGPRAVGGRSTLVREPAQLAIRTLAAVVSVRWDDDDWVELTGLPAKLIALLVADGGVTPLERCLDVLWPDADVQAARNRFHGVVLRARRRLGSATDGPLQVLDGTVRLASTGDVVLDVDAWRLERGLLPVDDYRSDFCLAQFAYDEFAVEARHRLRARFEQASRAHPRV